MFKGNSVQIHTNISIQEHAPVFFVCGAIAILIHCNPADPGRNNNVMKITLLMRRVSAGKMRACEDHASITDFFGPLS